MAGETTFSSLLFRHTSFNCGNRPFHLVVTILAPAHHPLAIAALRRGKVLVPADPGQAAQVDEGGAAVMPEQMVALACR